MYPVYISEYNSKHEKQVILLMIPNKEGLDYLSVKKLSELLREIRSKHVGDFYCLNCLHLFRTKNELENKDFCDVVIPSEHTKISEFNQYQKCDIVKWGGCKNNLEQSSTTKEK